MKHKHLSTYFSGSYTNAKGIEYDIRGSLTSLPKGNFSEFPEDFFIAFSYQVSEIGDGFLTFPQSGHGYLKLEDSIWIIGTVIEKNQISTFKPLHTPAFTWLKDIILQAYQQKAETIL